VGAVTLAAGFVGPAPRNLRNVKLLAAAHKSLVHHFCLVDNLGHAVNLGHGLLSKLLLMVACHLTTQNENAQFAPNR
jgi:hypothetical protein